MAGLRTKFWNNEQEKRAWISRVLFYLVYLIFVAICGWFMRGLI